MNYKKGIPTHRLAFFEPLLFSRSELIIKHLLYAIIVMEIRNETV